jgi:hypothetical protein
VLVVHAFVRFDRIFNKLYSNFLDEDLALE